VAGLRSPRPGPPGSPGPQGPPRPPASPRSSSPPPRASGREGPCRSSQTSVKQTEGEVTTSGGVELGMWREEIAACAQALTVQDIRMLRSFQRPPAAVASILEATAVLLGVDTDWKAVRKMLQPDLPERLQGIDVEALTISQFKRVRRLLAQQDLAEEPMRGACPAVVPLATWCRAIGSCLARTRSWGGPEVVSCVEPRGGACATPPIMDIEPRQPWVAPPLPAAIAHELQAGTPAAPQATPQVADGPAAKAAGLTITPDLSKISRSELAKVSELSISRAGVGSVRFHGITDCTNLDVPSLVHLDVGEVLVYPVPGTKPPVGRGLNKSATITMHQCWPPNGRGHLNDSKAQERYRKKIQQMTEEKKATFIDYDCNTGIWKFQVEHF